MAGRRSDTQQTVTPYFTVAAADRLIAFLESVLEGRLLLEDRYDDGRVRHARVCIGDSIIMLNEASDDYVANESQIHLLVADVDGTFARALQEGASALMEPNDRAHGERMAGFVDPCANTWWIAQVVTHSG